MKAIKQVKLSLHFISRFVEVSPNVRQQLIVLDAIAAMSRLADSCAISDLLEARSM